ncbi:unnamed protein product [Rotaria magnacalcarata]|uniref:U3 small nucleolar RNA-associated protein 13 C-terminal domain-containing protein n=3 Tax=Rotaria magnacalcarata TaxID=392030 RepID=A0A816YDE1_9BILA|nr:unnamed protein product [Rotaria magnacalcarata]CAF2219533.1 unnamed protein product [Rotaria magnacalcarata]
MVREKENFVKQSTHTSFYTGGQFAISNDGQYLLCTYNALVHILDIETQQIVRSIGEDDTSSEIASFALFNDLIVIAYRNQLLRQFDWKTSTCLRTWKSVHKNTITCMTFNPSGSLLATGGADFTVKIWDVEHLYYTHNLKGATSIIRVVLFYTSENKKIHVISGSDDGRIYMHNLHTSGAKPAVLEGHMSTVTSFVLHYDHTLISSGRDRVVVIWDLQTLSSTRTIPVMETVEALISLPSMDYLKPLKIKQTFSPNEPLFFTFGNSGLVKLWSGTTGRCLLIQEDKTHEKTAGNSYSKDKEHEQVFLNAYFNETTRMFYTNTVDHNIVAFNIKKLKLEKQFIGELGDVLDVRFFNDNDNNPLYAIVANNDEKVKIFNLNTWHCQMLKGHTDIVIGLDISYDHSLLATCSKDDIVRIWSYDSDTSSFSCVALAEGHTGDVAAIAFSKTSNAFIVSGSQDTTAKVWSLEKLILDKDLSIEPQHLSSLFTLKTHDKEVNSVSVSINDKHFATGSADKTAKIWDIRNQKLLAVLSGHRRGIWCVQYSPVNPELATASADGLIKIWSTKDYNCLHTIEGHDASVLRIVYLSMGTQLISSGSDGLLKLWDLKTSTCVKSIDAHEGKIWGMTASTDESLLVTCASDSSVIVWRDSTEEERQAKRDNVEEVLLMEQEVSNLLINKKYHEALKIALNLNQPFRALKILKEILNEIDGIDHLKNTLLQFSDDHLNLLFSYVIDWNTNTRHSTEAQIIIKMLLSIVTPDKILKLPNGQKCVESLLPYTERHMARIERLSQQVLFLDFSWHSMKYLDQSSNVSTSEEFSTT